MKMKATFGGGCFWCMIQPFDKLEGVERVVAGYAGGDKVNPTYEEVSRGATNYVEAVQIEYDPKKVSYKKLLEVFWRQINPLDDEGQFADKGRQYKTVIFYHGQEQKLEAVKSKKKLEEKLKKKVVTMIKKFTSFYPAEEYHQDYYKKSPIRYKMYKTMSGRAKFLREFWKK